MNKKPEFRPGDLVEVLSPDEILQTLDARGTLAGLPFMPEMLEFCGKQFKIFKRVEKTCYDAARMEMREFKNSDVLLLEGLRCSGQEHGGCQKGCMLFWKEAWLRKVEGGESPSAVDRDTYKLRARLKTTAGPDRFFCQSTELGLATDPLPRSRRIEKCFRDVQVGNYTVFEMLGWVFGPIVRKISQKLRGEGPRGTQVHTPTETSNLQRGEWVEVKSLEEIAHTLDAAGKNRGLHFSEDMTVFCGRRFRVRDRLDRMILESTGQMRDLKNTVILEGVQCGCPYTIGGCPRSVLQYWREIWLKRVPTGQLLS